MRNVLRVIFGTSIVAFMAVFIYQVNKLSHGPISSLCKTAFFIVPQSFSELAILIFVFLGIKLQRFFAELKG